MGKYTESPAWADVVPIEQDDGGVNSLAAIAYSEQYAEAMSYLRAVMAANDMSNRVMDLTEDIIGMNPAHYTVWLYRAKTLFNLNLPIGDEIAWLNPIALAHLKNYQIWQHRQTIIDALGDPAGEADFLAKMFYKDSKNYHVWSYRQWVVQRFGLWDDTHGELRFCEKMLDEDVRNNSAWNHRWFVVFGKDEKVPEDKDVVRRELAYVESKIALAPQNASPWNYLRALTRLARGSAAVPPSSLLDFASKFASVDGPVKSSHALEMLATIYGEKKGSQADAEKALDLLSEKYDPIRANYWRYRKAAVVAAETTIA